MRVILDFVRSSESLGIFTQLHFSKLLCWLNYNGYSGKKYIKSQYKSSLACEDISYLIIQELMNTIKFQSLKKMKQWWESELQIS